MEAEGRLRRGWGCGLRWLHCAFLELRNLLPPGPQCLGSGASSGRSLVSLCSAVPDPGTDPRSFGTEGWQCFGLGNLRGEVLSLRDPQFCREWPRCYP